MSQNPIPTLVLPSPYDTTQQARNNQALILWSKTISPRMLGVGTPIFAINGAAPPAPPSDAYLGFRGGVEVALTSGAGVLTLPVLFPTGWLSLQMTGPGSYTYVTAFAGIQSVSIRSSTGATGTELVDVDAIGW